MPLHGLTTGKGWEDRRHRGGGGERLGAVTPTTLWVGSDDFGGEVRVHRGGRGSADQEDSEAFWDSLVLQREPPLSVVLAAEEQCLDYN